MQHLSCLRMRTRWEKQNWGAQAQCTGKVVLHRGAINGGTGDSLQPVVGTNPRHAKEAGWPTGGRAGWLVAAWLKRVRRRRKIDGINQDAQRRVLQHPHSGVVIARC